MPIIDRTLKLWCHR